MMGQIGYITPAVLGLPTGGNKFMWLYNYNLLGYPHSGTKSKWLNNSSRLRDPSVGKMVKYHPPSWGVSGHITFRIRGPQSTDKFIMATEALPTWGTTCGHNGYTTPPFLGSPKQGRDQSGYITPADLGVQIWVNGSIRDANLQVHKLWTKGNLAKRIDALLENQRWAKWFHYPCPLGSLHAAKVAT